MKLLAIWLCAVDLCAGGILAITVAANAPQPNAFEATRATIIQEIQASAIEIGYAITTDGRVTWRGTGTTTSIALSGLDVLRIGRGYYIHNHPTWPRPNCRLSTADMEFAKTYHLAGIEAVCRDGTSDAWRPTP